MDRKEYYKQIKKNGKDTLEYYLKFKQKNNSIDAMKKTRDEFPQLTIIEAKEIMVICDTTYKSLDEYQESLVNDINEFLKE